MLLHKTFRTGLIFLNQSKWVQIVVCYKQNLQKCKYLWTTILSQSNPLFWQNLALWVIFSQFGVKGIEKVEKLKELWEVMLKNLENDQNWPFWANLTDFFGKIHHCGSFLASLVWKESKKLKNSKNLPMYLPPQKCKFLRFWMKWDALVAKDGKSCELHENGHSEWIWASLWGKTCKMTRIGHFEPI